MSFASDKLSQLQAQRDSVAGDLARLKNSADIQVNAITTQLAADTDPLAAQLATLDAQLQVLSDVVAQEQAATPTDAPAADAEQPAQ